MLTCAGIDVSKDVLQIELDPQGMGAVFPNDINDFSKMVDWLKCHQVSRALLEATGGYAYPASHTPWQEMQRSVVGQLDTGAILEGAEKYQRIAQRGPPRHNH